MAVIARFYVRSVELLGWATIIKMSAVTKGQENHEFFSATPSGSIEMTIKNEAAAARFKPGQEVDVSFDV